MKAKEYDNVESLKKHTDIEIKLMQQKHLIETIAKEKKRVEEELY